MKASIRIALFTNGFLALVLLFVGAICFVPYGVATSAKLSDRVYYSGNADSRYVALMFNVYWGTEYIPSILDTLDEYEVKATFFIGGSWADDNAQVLKEIARRGHELGNHGYFHKDQSKLSEAENASEIDVCGRLVKQLTGVSPALFAPPSGAYGEAAVNAAQSLGYKVILWSKDTIDWRDHDQSIIYRRATQNVKGGDLILAHPTEETAAALPSVLRYYRDNNWQQVTVSENISGIEKV